MVARQIETIDICSFLLCYFWLWLECHHLFVLHLFSFGISTSSDPIPLIVASGRLAGVAFILEGTNCWIDPV